MWVPGRDRRARFTVPARRLLVTHRHHDRRGDGYAMRTNKAAGLRGCLWVVRNGSSVTAAIGTGKHVRAAQAANDQHEDQEDEPRHD